MNCPEVLRLFLMTCPVPNFIFNLELPKEWFKSKVSIHQIQK